MSRAALLPALALLAGCLQATHPAAVPEAAPLAFGAPVEVTCRQFCYEPSVAVDGAGRIAVTANTLDAATLMVSSDGGASFAPRPVPPVPQDPASPLVPWRDDVVVQSAPDGALWLSALVGTPNVGTPVGATGFDYRGLQVARTADGGLTWSPNTLFRPGERVDRQWLAFGAGRTYLTWQTFDAGVGVARSDDGGLSFSATARLDGEHVTGAPCVRPSGRVVWPTVGGHGLVAQLSDDGGAHWGAAPIGSGAYFPALGCGQDRLQVAWWTPGGIHVAASADEGASWSVLPEWEGRLTAPSVSPALVGTPATNVASFRLEGDGTATLEAQRLDAAGFHRGTVATGIHPYVNKTRANTDYASMAALPDGRLVLVWSPASERVQVAVESR